MNRNSFLLKAFIVVCFMPLNSRAEETPNEESPHVRSTYDTLRGVVYAKRGDLSLRADLYIPRAEGRHPGVLVVHGGAWRSGKRSQLAGFSHALAKSGFTAVTISYRLAPQHLFPAQIEDCKTAVRWMRENADKYKIDPSRLGGVGYSAGGHLVALLGTTDADDGLEGPDGQANRHSTRLQAYVAGGAPCDFRSWPNDHILSYWLGTSRDKQPKTYLRASPFHFISEDDPPGFFFHGEKDNIVPVANSRTMVAGLKKAGVTTSLHEVKDAGHIGALFDRQASQASIDFLVKHLSQPEHQDAEDLGAEEFDAGPPRGSQKAKDSE